MLKRLALLPFALIALAFASVSHADPAPSAFVPAPLVYHAQIDRPLLEPAFWHGVAAGGSSCANTPLLVNISGTNNCYNNTAYASYTSIPGAVSTPGTISGAGSSSVYIPDGSGGLTAIASGAPMVSAGGFYPEPPSGNQVMASNAFTGAPWNYTTITVASAGGGVTDPVGGTSAKLLTGTGAYATDVQLIPFSLNTPETCTVFMKATGSATNQQFGTLAIISDSGGTTKLQVRDQSLATASDTSAVESNFGNAAMTGHGEFIFNNGWKEIWLSFSQTATETLDIQVLTGVSNGTNYNGYTIYAYGAQCTPGNAAFYLPNTSTTATVSRTGDVLTVPNPAPTTVATATYNGTHHEQLPPSSTLDLANSQDLWTGSLPLNRVSVSTPAAVPSLASAQGFNTLTYDIPLNGFTNDNFDSQASLRPGYQAYLDNCFGTAASSLVGVFFVDVNGDLDVGGNNNTVQSASCLAASPGSVGVAFGGGFYSKEVANWTVDGAEFNGVTNGTTTLTVGGPLHGAPIYVGELLWVGGAQPSGNPAITSFGTGTGGAGTYILSTTVAASTSAMTLSNPNKSWNSPKWFYAQERNEYNGSGGRQQWVGQANPYSVFGEQDSNEIFNGNYGGDPWTGCFTSHFWQGNPEFSTQNGSCATTQTSGTQSPDVTMESVWLPATPTASGFWSEYYNGVLVLTNSWTRFVDDSALATTAPSTASATVGVNIPCKADWVSGGNLNVVDTSVSKYAAGVMGTLLSCGSGTITMTGNSAINGSNGDNIVVIEKAPSNGKPWDLSAMDIDHATWNAGCITLCIIKSLQYYQSSYAGNERN